jgi:hypothetical protein
VAKQPGFVSEEIFVDEGTLTAEVLMVPGDVLLVTMFRSAPSECRSGAFVFRSPPVRVPVGRVRLPIEPLRVPGAARRVPLAAAFPASRNWSVLLWSDFERNALPQQASLPLRSPFLDPHTMVANREKPHETSQRS